MIRAVVFDLDGTLANTGHLYDGLRFPSMVLGNGVDSAGNPITAHTWQWSREISEVPARLIERGYWVAIATRAPLPYASTLLHLLGVDYHALAGSCGPGTAKSETLRRLAKDFQVDLTEMAYCGDLPEDRAIARHAGVRFFNATQLHDLSILHECSGSHNYEFQSLSETPNQPLLDSAWDHFAAFGSITSDFTLRSLNAVHLSHVRRYLDLSEERTLPRRLPARYSETAGNPAHGVSAIRAAMAIRILRSYPGSPFRREIQIEMFRHLSSIDCAEILNPLKSNRFGLRPFLITRREIQSDSGLCFHYLSALRRAWPEIGNPGPPPLTSAMCFQSDGDAGRVLRIAKEYGGTPGTRFRSGRNVQLGYLDFVADLIASRVDTSDSRRLVPVPAAAFSAEQPGQASTRIARMVADLRGLTIAPLLRRQGDDYVVEKEILAQDPRPSQVDLIDDQVTKGSTLTRCRIVLEQAGISVSRAYTYSANEAVLRDFNRQPTVSIADRFQGLLG